MPMMRESGRLLHCLPALLVGALLCSFSAGDAAVTVEAKLDAYTDYYSRGFSAGDGVLQPTLKLSEERLSLTLWANCDPAEDEPCTELDYTLERSFPAGKLEGVVGHTYYTFLPFAECARSREVYAGLTKPGRVPVGVKVFYDYGAGEGTYAELSGSAPVRLGNGEGTLALALGYNRHQFRADSGFSHALATLSREFVLGSLRVTPIAAYAVGLDTEFESTSYFGLSLSAAPKCR